MSGTGSGEIMPSISPIDGTEIGKVQCAVEADVENVIDRATEAFKTWRMVPAPRRGDVVRQIGNALREHKKELGELITLETGKLRMEGRRAEGIVQRAGSIGQRALRLLNTFFLKNQI